jgi:succinate dehydrogenase/fumarate reductase flavoprotein subunit
MNRYESHQYDVIVIGPAGRGGAAAAVAIKQRGSEW